MMNITELNENQHISGDIKLNAAFSQFRHLLAELRKKELTPQIIETVNQDVEAINSSTQIENDLKKFLQKKQSKIISLVEK